MVHLKPKKASDAITGWPKLVKGNRVDILGRDGYEDNWYKVCVGRSVHRGMLGRIVLKSMTKIPR